MSRRSFSKKLLLLLLLVVVLATIVVDAKTTTTTKAAKATTTKAPKAKTTTTKAPKAKTTTTKAAKSTATPKLVVPKAAQPLGSWKVIGNSGVAAMHITLVEPNKMLIIDKAENNPVKLPNGRAAYNAEYNLDTNKFRLLQVSTNTFCTAGAFLGNGTLLGGGGAEQRGGQKALAGFQSLRLFNPCNDNKCTWIENPSDKNFVMSGGNRWYPTMTSLPDGRVFIIGGSNQSLAINGINYDNPTWEIFPKEKRGAVRMPWLHAQLPNNLYPFVHVLKDGHLFIFAGTRSIIFDYVSNKIIQQLPEIPGGTRSYPLTGSSVLLPLDPANNYAQIILICGGTQMMKVSSAALNTCASIDLSEKTPKWVMETMPFPRLMGDAVILADGRIMFVNGAQQGFAGYGHGDKPIMTPVVYDRSLPVGKRFSALASTNIARMYHSVAMTLPDASVFVAGSNPNQNVDTSATVKFPTEYRIQRYTPSFLTTDQPRPVLKTQAPAKIGYNKKFTLTVDLGTSKYTPSVRVALMHHGFITHSNHMSQRYVYLTSAITKTTGNVITLDVTTPPNSNIMPPGPMYAYVLNNNVPSVATNFLLD